MIKGDNLNLVIAGHSQGYIKYIRLTVKKTTTGAI